MIPDVKQLQQKDGIACSESERQAIIDHVHTHYRLSLERYASRMIRNPEDAADSVQEALQQAFRKYDTYKYEQSAKALEDPVLPWIKKILHHQCLAELRKPSRDLVPFTDGDDVAAEPAAEATYIEQTGKQRVIDAARREASHLSPALRRTAEQIVNYIDENEDEPSGDVLAKLLGTNLDNAAQMKSRMRRKLHDLCKGELEL